MQDLLENLGSLAQRDILVFRLCRFLEFVTAASTCNMCCRETQVYGSSIFWGCKALRAEIAIVICRGMLATAACISNENTRVAAMEFEGARVRVFSQNVWILCDSSF